MSRWPRGPVAATRKFPQGLFHPEAVVGIFRRLSQQRLSPFAPFIQLFLLGLGCRLGWGSPDILHLEHFTPSPSNKRHQVGGVRLRLHSNRRAVGDRDMDGVGIGAFQHRRLPIWVERDVGRLRPGDRRTGFDQHQGLRCPVADVLDRHGRGRVECGPWPGDGLEVGVGRLAVLHWGRNTSGMNAASFLLFGPSHGSSNLNCRTRSRD